MLTLTACGKETEKEIGSSLEIEESSFDSSEELISEEITSTNSSEVSIESNEAETFESSAEEASEECSHEMGEWQITLPPSCIIDGEQTRVCTLCGFSEKEVIDILPHEESIVSGTAPTCTENGLSDGKICLLCNTVLEEQTVIEAKGHVYSEEEKVDSTCTEKGYTVYKCTCGESYNGDFALLANHVYEETVISPTCQKDGYTLHKCVSCDKSYKDNYTKGEHEYLSTEVAPSCEKDGYVLHECKVCKTSYKDSTTSKLGHSYVKSVVLPTVSTQGYTKYTCSVCQNSYKENYTDYDYICQGGYAGNSTVLAMGIDVSKWNHKKDSQGNYLPLDWVAIKKSGVDFVILKAGSTVGEDPVFQMNYEDAKAADLDVGAYYYSYALNVEDAKKEAEHFIELIKGKKFEYPLYMDFEDSSQRPIAAKTKTEMIKAFSSTLQNAGYYVGLYTGYYWMNPRFDILETEAVIDMIDIWFAHIDSAESVSVNTVYSWNAEDHLGHPEFGMWQYAHKGVFDFISNEFFDFNYAYKDYPSIIKRLGLNGYTAQESETEYVWVKVKNLNVRSYWDTSVSSNIIDIVHKGDKFEILEKTKEYIKINYKGQTAYISADNEHISFIPI